MIAPPEIKSEFQRALDLLGGLVRDDPLSSKYQLALARCHRSVLPVAWANDDDDLASNAKLRSIAILQELADSAPGDPALRFELADTLAMTPNADSRTPLSDTEVADLMRSVEITARLQQQFPTATEYAVLAANSHQKLGTHFMAAGMWSESEKQLTEAEHLLDPLVTSAPENPLFQVALARGRWELADSLRRQGSLQHSREVLDKAIRGYETFRDSDAGRRSSPGLLEGLYRQLARTLEQLGEKALADQASETADRLRRAPNETRPPLH